MILVAQKQANNVNVKSQPLGNFCQLESIFLQVFQSCFVWKAYSIPPLHLEYANWLTEIFLELEARIFENINKCHIEQNLSGLHAFKTLL